MRVITLFLLSFSVFAQWQEVDCYTLTPSEFRNTVHLQPVLSYRSGSPSYRTQYKDLQYKVTSSYHPINGCSYEIRSRDGKKVYAFNSNGEINYTTLDPDTSHTHFIDPKATAVRLFLNKSSGEVKIKLQNDSELYFNPNSDRIDNSKSTGLTVQYENGGKKLKISSNKDMVFDFGYSSGDSQKRQPDGSVTLKLKSQTCKIPTSALFDFAHTCEHIKSGDAYYKRTCYSPRSRLWADMRKHYGSSASVKYIDGVKLKANYKGLLANLKSHGQCTNLGPKKHKKTPVKPINCKQEVLKYFKYELSEREIKDYFKTKSVLSLSKISYISGQLNKISETDLRSKILKIQRLINRRSEHAFRKDLVLTKPARTKFKLLDLISRYRIQSNGRKDKIEVTRSDLKMLLVLINKSEQRGGDFNDKLERLLNTYTDKSTTAQKKKAKVQKLRKKIEKQTQGLVDYLFKKGCTTKGDFGDCKRANQQITPDFLLEDHKDIVEELYKNFFKR